MTLKNFSELNNVHRTFLEEIGNMGAENVSTEISNMFSSSTSISASQLRINPAIVAGKVADMLSGRTEIFSISLCEAMKGSLLLAFPYPTIERLATTFFPDISVKNKDDVNEMTLSVVRETVNIAAASYVNRLASVSGLTVDISVPNSVETPSKELPELYNASGNAVCSIKNTVTFLDSEHSFDVILYPEITTISSFIEKIGIGVPNE